MNSSLNIDTTSSNAQKKVNIRMQQATTAANLKALAELISVTMLNENFSSKVGGTFDVEYVAEIKHTPKGLSNFIRDPVITFLPNDLATHTHLKTKLNDSNDINLSHVLKFKDESEENVSSTELEKKVELILNFVEDEIQPEIGKYLHQAKRKNSFTKSTRKNGGKNAEKALEVMSSAVLILKEKFNLQN